MTNNNDERNKNIKYTGSGKSAPAKGASAASGTHMDKPLPRKRKKKKKHRVFLTVLFLLLLIFLIGCLVAGGYVLSLAKDLPDITAEDLVNAQTSFVYDQGGTEIASLHGGENRITVGLAEMPDYLVDALIATEDVRFYQHHGVDYRGVARALVVDAIDTVKSGQISFTQGFSTITMQLMRNVISEFEKTIPRKIKEVLLAIEFEKQYDKDEILYYYLNEIYLGANIYGVQAASEYYFGKDVGDITLSEAALLIGILRSPGDYDPYTEPERAINVRNTVLNQLIKYYPDQYGVIAEAAKAEELVVYEGDEDTATYEYPWYVDYVISEGMDIVESMGLDSSYIYTGGLHIYTVLDPHVQQAMETVYADAENFPESSTKDIVESAMAIVDPATGQIKGLMGGRVYTARRGFNRATDLIRSPGSTIKPLVAYGPAVELGYGAGYVIDDSPVTYGSWSPNNDDRAFQGRITMRKAIMGSRNVCAVKMLAAIGAETGYEFGLKLGLPLVETDAGNLSLTLGGLTTGVAPLDMAAAFATFANAGVFTEPYSIAYITDAKGEVIYSANPALTDVFAPDTAYIMTDMLMSAVNGGTGGNARIDGWQVAGKTGTNGLPSASDDPDYAGKTGTKDAWFCGYTTALAGAVWMGYDNKKDDEGTLQYLSNVYGGSYPARLWKAVMVKALENYENKNFSRPDGVISATIDLKSGKSPSSLTPAEFIGSELFRAGYGPQGISDVWEQVMICADTGLIASDFCPNVIPKVMLTYGEGQAPSEKVADYALYKPSAACNVHFSYSTRLQSIFVCTDPRHHGVPAIANIPTYGSTGGCPDEYVELRYYTASSMPTTYCGLEDHQVSGTSLLNPGAGNSQFEEEEDNSWWNFSSDVTPPTPENLRVGVTNSGIYVAWDGDSDDSVLYVLERSSDDGGKAQRFKVSGLEYTDAGLTKGVTYTYRVYALNTDSEKYSSWSGSVSIAY